ncbi:MAG: hemolysin family protein [Limisphaerales bacterium]
MDAPQSLTLAAMAGCAVASFFFALAETALFSLGKRQVRQLAAQQPARAGRIERLLAAPQDLLATIVFGNTFANAGMLAGGLWLALSGRWSLWPTVAALFIVVVVFCEVWPKTLAVRRPDVWALRIAPLLGLAHRVTLPFRRLAQGLNSLLLRLLVPASLKPLPPVSEADYQELLELAQQQGALAASEKEIILQIIRLDHRTVREVMRPRSQMACIPDDLTVPEMIAAARRHGFRRLPMYDESPETIVGVLNTRALLLNPDADLSEVIEFPSFVPQSMNLLQLLRSLQRQQRGMAIVLDEFGGTAGMVTIEDILEEVIGPMRQVTAVGGRIERLDARRWRLGGATRLDDFRREYPALGEVAGVETVGGLLVRLLEVVPAPGESAVFRGLKLTAVAADERRVLEVLAEVVS